MSQSRRGHRMGADDSTVRIVVSTVTAQVFSPFEARGCICTLPKRQRLWDSVEKCWVISAGAVRSLEIALRAEGFTVVVRYHDSAQTPPPRRGRADTWADALYEALGPQLADKAFRALVPVLHPDRGGDTEAMQMLNAARDRAVKR